VTRAQRWLWLDQIRVCTREKTLSPQAGHVALALGVYYVNGSSEAWPSQKELAAATGLSARTVWGALRELEQHGLLEVRHGPPARTFGHVYRLRNLAPGARFGERQSETA
jgi:DNA-binding MarR family transcriptional regulator